jgi:uncharacterized protein (UPF0210 family)
MKIRSITYFCNPGYPLDEKKLRAAGLFSAEAKKAFEEAGFEVQTTRLATVPFPRLLGTGKISETPKLVEKLMSVLAETGISYAALGPAVPDIPTSYGVIPEAIAASKNIFFSGILADHRTGISLPAVHACAQVIARTAPVEPNGFANLQFAALANVPPGSPFFPAAYHEGDEPAFAVAVEAADLAVSAFEGAASLEAGRAKLTAAIEANARQIVVVANLLKYRFSLRFGGIDFSLAPFPKEAQSIGAAFERMGVPRAGLHGSLTAAAILTEALDRADFPHAGFSGLMLPVLEDKMLAWRAAEGTLSVKDLLLYSAVCGTGLDTVPLAGDTTPEQLSALLLDLAALALRLDKPLTARLMPVPGKKAGDPTGFTFDYFANSRVMALRAEPLKGMLGGDETFPLKPRELRS